MVLDKTSNLQPTCKPLSPMVYFCEQREANSAWPKTQHTHTFTSETPAKRGVSCREIQPISFQPNRSTRRFQGSEACSLGHIHWKSWTEREWVNWSKNPIFNASRPAFPFRTWTVTNRRRAQRTNITPCDLSRMPTSEQDKLSTTSGESTPSTAHTSAPIPMLPQSELKHRGTFTVGAFFTPRHSDERLKHQ